MEGMEMMRRFLILASLLCAAPAQAQLDAKNAEFDAYVAKAVKDWMAPGLAIAVVKDGKVVFAKGYGVREVGKPALVDTETVFPIASTTKAMTSAAIAMLVDEGKIRWDDPVIKYLPSLRLYDPYVTRELTVRDLLTHRSGLGNADYLWAVSDLSADEMMSKLSLIQPSYSLRSSFIYQNVMYVMAGQVIAAASGMPWATFIQKRIFDPLGMKHSYTMVANIPPGTNAAEPHWRYGRDTLVAIKRSTEKGITSAGSVWSSVADMSRWMIFLLDSGRANGKQLIKPPTFAELLTPQQMVPPDEFYPTMALTHPHWMTYALGWFQHDYQGRMLDFHTGSLNGNVAIIGLIPDERFGVYVLANRDHVEVRHALMYKAIDLYLGNPSRDWSAELKALYDARSARGDSARALQERKRIKGTKPSVALSNYAGTYESPIYGRIIVTEHAGKLDIDLGPELKGRLEHWQYDRFRAVYDDRWQGTDIVAFTIGGDGIASALDLSGLAFRRVAAGH
jgi:CubicO group peptidase (beta-lactamase class C family)